MTSTPKLDKTPLSRPDGLATARARGRVGGPKPKPRPRQAELARQMYGQVGDDGKSR